MKIRLNKTQLLLTLNRVSKALSSSNSNASLGGILVQVVDNKMFLTATNTEIKIQSVIDLDSKESPEAVLIPGKLFLEIVRKIDSQFIEIITNECDIVIKSHKSKFTLNPLSLEQYPEIVFRKWDVETEFNTLDLSNLIKKTSFAVSNGSTRVILQGVNFKTKSNLLVASATDSFRVATTAISIEDNKEIDVILPAISLNELVKIVNDGVVKVKLSKTHALFSFRDTEFETRLIEGQFPNMDKFFPSNFIADATFERQELIQALERCTVLSNDSAGDVIKLELNNQVAKELKITSKQNEVGQAVEILEPKNATGSILMACSSKYLLDALRAFESQEITINYTGETSPFTITSEKETNHKQLILPIRVS